MRPECSRTGFSCIYHGGKGGQSPYISLPRFNSFILPWGGGHVLCSLVSFPLLFFDIGKDVWERKSAFFSFCLLLSLFLLTSPYLGISVDIIYFFFPTAPFCVVLIRSTSTITSSGSGCKLFHLRYVVFISQGAILSIYLFISIYLSLCLYLYRISFKYLCMVEVGSLDNQVVTCTP